MLELLAAVVISKPAQPIQPVVVQPTVVVEHRGSGRRERQR